MVEVAYLTKGGDMTSNINYPVAFASQLVTVSTTMVDLTDFFTQAEIDNASMCFLFVNTQSLRFDFSGNAVTVSDGAVLTNLLHPYLIYGDENMNNLRMIRNGASDSEVFIILAR